MFPGQPDVRIPDIQTSGSGPEIMTHITFPFGGMRNYTFGGLILDTLGHPLLLKNLPRSDWWKQLKDETYVSFDFALNGVFPKKADIITYDKMFFPTDTLTVEELGLSPAKFGIDAHDILRTQDGRWLIALIELDTLNGLSYAGCRVVTFDTLSGAIDWWSSFQDLPHGVDTSDYLHFYDGQAPPVGGHDYVHFNGFTEDLSDSTFIVSFRHTDMLTKVVPGNMGGNVIWKLPGSQEAYRDSLSLKWIGTDTTFSGNHHPAFLKSQGDTLWLSLHDNATHTNANQSSGIIIQINESDKTARITQRNVPGGYGVAMGSFTVNPGKTRFLDNLGLSFAIPAPIPGFQEYPGYINAAEFDENDNITREFSLKYYDAAYRMEYLQTDTNWYTQRPEISLTNTGPDSFSLSANAMVYWLVDSVIAEYDTDITLAYNSAERVRALHTYGGAWLVSLPYYPPSAPLSIQTLDFTPVLVYPNPASGDLNIQLPENWKGSSHVRLWNMSGQMVREIELNPNSLTTHVELFGLSGVFILDIGGLVKKRIVLLAK
jgi:hypothetical protein